MFKHIPIEVNPLLAVWSAVKLQQTIPEFPELLKHVPAETPLNSSDPRLRMLSEYRVRSYACRAYSWAVPTNDVIQKICEYGYQYGHLVEVASGSGYWMRLIRAANHRNKFTTLATDNSPWDKKNHYGEVDKLYTEVEKLDAIDAARLAAQRGAILLTVWPNYNDLWTGQMISEYMVHGGKCVIYIGEGSGGCTGSDWMHWLLNNYFTETIPGWDDDDQFDDVCQWEGIRDRMHIYTRNELDYNPNAHGETKEFWEKDYFAREEEHQKFLEEIRDPKPYIPVSTVPESYVSFGV